MPELPEVQTVVNSLAPRIVGQTIRDVDLVRPDIVTPLGLDLRACLIERHVIDLVRRAKRIVFTLSDDSCFYIHLGMTGRLTFALPAAARQKHTHLVLGFGEFEIHFCDPRRFGGIWWLGKDADAIAKNIGPEPLTLHWKVLKSALGRTSKAIKTALLDQRIIAGIGNIYADESLFAAGIFPLTPANKISDEKIKLLTKSMKKTLRLALSHRGSTLRDYVDAQGGKGAFQRLHNVYDRANKPCTVCNTPISRIVVGGRSTCFCRKCQPRVRVSNYRRTKKR